MTEPTSPPEESTSRTGPPERPPGRRKIVVVILATLLVAAALLGWLYLTKPTPSASCGAPVMSPATTTTPIKHLFVIVKENHAFENYFGGLPGVTGYPPNGSFPLALNGSGVVHPFPLTGYSTPDFPHDVASSVADFNGGQNNLFVAVAHAAGDSNPQDAVGYYGPTQLPGYYAYAKNYSLGDHFFAGFLGPTYPNRVFNIAAYAGAWGSDTPPPASVSAQPTILDQLNSARIPWDYDWSGPLPFQLAPTFFPSIANNPCNAGQMVPITALSDQLAGKVAPSVVYVDPSNDLIFSEHPTGNVSLGEEWTIGVVNAIFSSPVANSSAILIWFDENGGYWDPVPPPPTSTGRDGFRVPFLVLSPWTPAGKVCSQTLDPASVLRFIDTNWKMPFLNPRVSAAADLSCFFNFSSPPRPALVLPSPIGFAHVPAPFELRSSPVAAGLTLSSPWVAVAAVWRERPVPSEPFWPMSG